MWFDKVEKPESCQVIQVKMNSSNKGIILVTNDYEAFLFFQAKEAVFLVEALEVWTHHPDKIGKGVWIEPNKAQKRGWEFGIKGECEWFYDSAKGVYQTSKPEEESAENPFLLGLTSQPVQPPLSQVTGVDISTPRKERKKSLEG